MADERIDIEVKAKADFDEVKSLEKILDEIISKGDLTVNVTSDSSELDDAQEKTEELDGTEITETISTDSSELDDAEGKIEEIDGTEMNTTVSADSSELDKVLEKTDEVQQSMEQTGNTDFGKMSASSSMYLANQINALGTSAEGMADGMNEAKITLGQLSTVTGVAEGDMANLVTYISNATFPNEEAMMYIKNLQQMGVDSKNFSESATNIDRINDAFGMGAVTTNSMATELSVLGVDMNNVSSAFNALAYANANTKGGMENFYTFLRKYDADLNELGYDVDQTAVIISGATQKFGGGRAALTGLSTALKEADGDSRKLEEALDLQAGSLDNASSITGQYEGQLMQLASEEMEHKTILDQLGAVWEDITLQCGGLIEGVAGVAGVFGRLGSMGMTVMGIKELILAMKTLSSTSLPSSIKGLTNFGTTLKTSMGSSSLGSTIKSLLRIEGETAVIKGEVSAIDKTASSTKTTGGLQKMGLQLQGVNQGAMEVGIAGEEGYVAGATEEAGAGGLQAVATGMWSLIVPIAQIAVVVAIIIAIIGALVAEVILIVKGIQLLIEAMDFGSVDFSKTIKGLKQLGNAVWEIGKIMLGMTFTALVTGIYKFLTLGGLVNPIERAKEDIKNTIGVLNEIGTYGTVDSKVADNLKNIGESIQAVGDVVGAMADTSFTVIMGNFMTLGGLLGDFQSLMNQAKEDIGNAIKVINELELDNINDSTIEKLQRVSEALKSFGDAMSGLGDIQWTEFMNEVNPFSDINQSLKSAKDDLVTASRTLQEYDGLEEPPKDVGKKIKSVADNLTNISNALSNMSDIAWTEGMNDLNPLINITESLVSAKGQIWFTAQKLQEMNDMPAIPTTVGDKLNVLGNVLGKVVNVFKSIEYLDGVVFDVNVFRNLTESIDIAKQDIINTSKSLEGLGNDIKEMPEGLGDKIQRVTWVTNGVVSAMKSLNNLSGVVVDTEGIMTNIQDSEKVIVQASDKFSLISSEAESIDSEVGTKVQNVTSITKNVIDTINTLITLPMVSEDIGTKVQQGVTAIISTIQEINRISGQSVNGDVAGIVTSVSTTLQNLKDTLSSLSGSFSASAQPIGTNIVNGIKQGMSTLTSTVKTLVSTALTTSASSGWTGGSYIGTSIMGGFKSAFNLHTTMSTELSYTLQAINNAKATYQGAGTELGKSVVKGFQLGINTGSPGDVYNTMEDELNYVKGLIPNYNTPLNDLSANLGKNVVSGFENNNTLGLNSNTGNITENNSNTSPSINIYVEGNINNEDTMDKLVEKLTKAITWSNAMGNRSV